MFGSKHFQLLLLLRFTAYFLIQIGLLTILLTSEPVIAEEVKFSLRQAIGMQEVVPQSSAAAQAGTNNPGQPGSGFADILKDGGKQVIVPVSTDFGIVIEKIGANAKIIPNVDPSNEAEYGPALMEGVAHAKGTAFPGQKGNIYLFSHSTDAPWNIVRYNAIFFLLNKLEVGDRVILFYKGLRFDYTVFDKTVVKPTDVHFLTDTYTDSVLTMQTCDPPGTLMNRLIVRAKLASN